MAIVREVPLQLCDEWIQFEISRGARSQVIHAEEAPSLGSAVAFGGNHFLVWRVCAYDRQHEGSYVKQQCLELEELHNEEDAASGRVRIFLDEQIVDVKCLAGSERVFIIIVTLTSVHYAKIQLGDEPNLLHTLFPVAPAGGVSKQNWSKMTSWHQVLIAKEVFVAKDGQSWLCCDARLAEKMNQVEVFLGTNGGMTIALSTTLANRISDQDSWTKSELRQTSGGFSLFPFPPRTLTGGQRVSCVVVEGSDKVLTLSEDGKVKRWNTRTSKCLAERSITLDEDLGAGRLSSLCAFKMCIMPRQNKVIFALRAYDAPGASRLVESDLDKLADLRPKDSLLDKVLRVMDESLQMLGERSDQEVELKAMGSAIIDTDEVLVSGWQGASASVTLITRLHGEQKTERVFSQCAEVQSQVVLSSLYLDNMRAGSAAALPRGAPEPLQLIQENIFRPRRFSSAVLLNSLSQLYLKYRGQKAPLSTWPGPHAPAHRMQQLIWRTMEEIVSDARAAAVDVWHDLLAACEHHWRTDADGLLGVIGVDLPVGVCLLVKQRGMSVLRLAINTELDFHRLMLEAEIDSDLSRMHLDEPGGCLFLAYKALVWMESADPGGAVFSQRMLSQDAEVVVESTLRELLISSCEPPTGLDPAELMQDIDWLESRSGLCLSFDEHLAALGRYEAQHDASVPALGERGQESSWLSLYKQDVCEQLVKTHYEVVRGLALAMAFVEYQHQATVADDADDEPSENVRSKLRARVLAHLSNYHMLLWSAGRALILGASVDYIEGVQPSHLPLHAHKTLLSLCLADTHPLEEARRVEDFVKDPVTFICHPVGAAGGEEGLIWKAFTLVRARRVTGDDVVLAAQWKDLLALCDHPAGKGKHAHGSAETRGAVMASTAADAWWFREIVVAFVRGYSCLHLARWKETSKYFEIVLRGCRRLIAGADVESARALVAPHPLLTLHKELVGQGVFDRSDRRDTPALGELHRHRKLRDSMRKVTAASKWGPAVKNLLDYFLLLHDYLGPTGLIHSMRELVCSHIHRMRPTRGGGGGTAGQKDGADAGGGGELGNEGAIDSFRALMQLASESLRDLEARLDGIEAEYLDAQVYQSDAECVFAVHCFRYLVASAQHYLRVSWLTVYTDCGLFDEAYDLIAECIALCQDDDVSKMREVLDDGGDEYSDAEHWLNNYSSMDLDTYNNSRLKAEIQERLELRARKEAYKCLEEFVSDPRSTKKYLRPDKLCSFPWLNCSHTVDTLLRERCENPEHLDEAYHARYAFNIARSDYRTAGDTMMTYCFNLVEANLQGGGGGGAGSSGMPDGGERLVELSVLKKQMNSCLAAINCYSLIDQRFAFWIPPRTALLSTGKRQANTQGSRGASSADMDSAADSSMLAPEVITLPLLQQHYALLRARLRLEGQVKRDGLHKMVSFSLSQQQTLAQDTVKDLLAKGLVDDAISLAAAFCPSPSSSSTNPAPDALNSEEMCRRITQRCLECVLDPQAERLRDEDGIEAEDPWDSLRRFLLHFDGSAKPASLAQLLPHAERESAVALERTCPPTRGRLARVAAEAFLRLCPDADCALPPWLVHTMRAGKVRSGGAEFDAAGGDTCGLLRLLLRYNRLEEASQLVSQCLTLECDGTPVVPRMYGSVTRDLPTYEECQIIDISSTRYVPYSLIDQVLCRLESQGPSFGPNKYRSSLDSVKRSLEDWMRFTEMESEMVSAFCCCNEVNDCVNKVLAQERINPASGEVDEMISGAHVDIQKLVYALVTKVQSTTPIGKRFERLQTGHGKAVKKTDRETVFQRLCLQMLQRTRPRMCPLPGKRWEEAWDMVRNGNR